jgi:general secretion pathway protein I
LRRLIRRNHAIAGFTLIEAVVALMIIAIILSSVGAMMATNARATRSVEARLIRLELARAILSALPDRTELTLGGLVGETDGQPWRIDVSPFPAPEANSGAWIPLNIIITVGSREAGAIEFNTIRLQRKPN